jgi:hypothetical protein
MKRVIALAAAFVMLAGAANAAPCKDAKGKFIKCSAVAASSAPATTPAMSPVPASTSSAGKHPPHCTTGKVCGNSCIAKSKVCHK